MLYSAVGGKSGPQLGDSHSGVMSISSALAGAQNINALLAGDSITAANMAQTTTTHYAEGNGIITQLNAMMGHRFKLINDFDQGVGGETAQTRTASLSDYTTAVGKYPGTWVAFECYGRNDLSAGRTAAQVYDDRVTIIDHLLTLVDYVFVESIKPSDYGVNTVTYNGYAETVNGNLETYCAANPRLIFVDTYSVMGDSSGLTAAYNLEGDGIHLNATGANAAAQAYLAPVTALMGVKGDNTANDLIVNPTLTGTGGTVGTNTTGTVGDNWASAMSGGATDITRVFSKNGDNSQNITVTAGTGAGADEITYFYQDIVVTAADEGKVILPRMKIVVNSLTNAYWCGLQCLQLNSGGSTIYATTDLDKRLATDDYDVPDGQAFWLETPEAVLVEGCVKIRLRLAIGLVANGQAASADIDVFYGTVSETLSTSYLPEFIGSKLAFWMDTTQPSLFTVDGSNKCSVIADAAWSGNTAVPFTSFLGEFDYVQSDADIGGIAALRNAGATVENTSAGYRFPNGLTDITQARGMICIFRGDTTTSDPGGSSSNGVMGDGKFAATSTALMGVRQARDTHNAMTMVGYDYGSGYNDTTDEFKPYWARMDGTNIFGGYDLTTTEGPAAAVFTGRTETTYCYLGCNPEASTTPMIGWMTQALYFNADPTVGEMKYAIRKLAQLSGVSV